MLTRISLRPFTAARLRVLLLIAFGMMGAASSAIAQAPAKLVADGGASIKKAAIVFKIDGEWGETHWAGTFIHNSRMNLKLEKDLAPGEHTIELMYRLQPPVSVSFTAESGKRYEIVEHEGVVKVMCANDGSYVGVATPAIHVPATLADGEVCRVEQPARIVTAKNEKFTITVLKVDGRYGPHEDYPARYIFNDPGRKGDVALSLPAGAHEIEFFGTDGSSRTRPQTVRFTTEPGKTYEMRLTFEEFTDKAIRKYFRGMLSGEMVERSR